MEIKYSSLYVKFLTFFLRNCLEKHKPMNIRNLDINGKKILVIFEKSTKLGADEKYKH